MVHYPRPKFITRAHIRNARPFAWSDAEKRADHAAVVETCMRCAQSIANQRKQCRKPEHRRCEHCSKGNRGGCNKLPSEMNGRLNRLYQLRTAYANAVTAAAVPRNDAAVIRTGVKLARCQRQFNLELAHRRQVARRSGVALGTATQAPTTSPQFLSLILGEQRRIANALEQLVEHAARMGGPPAGDDSDESSGSSSDSEEDGDASGAEEAQVQGEEGEDEEQGEEEDEEE